MNSRETVESKKLDVWYDKPFVRAIVKEAMKLSPNLAAMMFAEQKMVIFLYKRVIVYKVLLDKYNTEGVSIEDHIKKLKNVMKMVDLNLVPIRRLQTDAAGLNKNKTGIIL